ncbi:hypothetical protein GOV05_03065 [Candidatus Woesearchaeota archaeon]|nr:hypothetical protein [Candidatus Woesearchaeota archaeon]
MKRVIIMLLFVVFSMFALAHTDLNISKAELIIEEKIAFNDLSEEDFEVLGEYYMEKVHPGEEHEIMDEMMGGEGSESLHEMHVMMGENFYSNYLESGTSNTGYNMMGSGTTGYGMMGSGTLIGGSSLFFGYYGFMTLIYLVIILVIVLLVKQIIKK